jgi:hypothetical protein
MGFVMDKKRVLAKKSSIQRLCFEPSPVMAEQQTAAYQVNSTNDDGRTRGIALPFPVVRVLPPERADGKWRFARERSQLPKLGGQRC